MSADDDCRELALRIECGDMRGMAPRALLAAVMAPVLAERERVLNVISTHLHQCSSPRGDEREAVRMSVVDAIIGRIREGK